MCLLNKIELKDIEFNWIQSKRCQIENQFNFANLISIYMQKLMKTTLLNFSVFQQNHLF